MLSDEERKAIESLIEIREFANLSSYKDVKINQLNAIDTILNLIKKQSKEIEELKKDKLELINKNHVVHLKDVEKELREMKKVIDTKNAEIECLNVIHESYKEMVEENNFISKDKIKAKIEEYDDKGMTVNLVNRSAGKTFQQAVHYEVKKVLQSLLEKE